MLYVLHYFIIILLSNFCPDIANIIQLFSKKMTMQFSWTLCYYEYTQDLVYIINLLYSFKYTQLSPIVKYMHSNIPSTINILYWYTYFIIVSNIFTQKHVVMQCLFLLNVLIKSHINIHTEEKYFKCNKVIMVKYEYLPMSIHTGDKPFKCNKCGMVKYGGWHCTIHIGEEPIKCNIYGTVKYEGLLIAEHSAIHIGEKPFKCNICGMMKYEDLPIAMHCIFHTGEKPFKCNICGVVKYVGWCINSWDDIGTYLHTTPTTKWL